MADAVHENNGKTVLQLAHAGFFANSKLTGQLPFAVSNIEGIAKSPRKELTAKEIGQIVQAMAGEAGIRVNIEIVEFGTLLSQFAERRFEAGLLGWSGRPDPDGNTYNNFVTGGGQNRAAYANPRFDALLDAARILTTAEHRRRAYADALAILNEDLPYLFLYWPKEYKVMTPKVQGFVHNPDGMMRLRNVWLSP